MEPESEKVVIHDSIIKRMWKGGFQKNSKRFVEPKYVILIVYKI